MPPGWVAAVIDWDKIAGDDYAVPSGAQLSVVVAGLSADLRSPDPVVRDRYAYSILATWIGRGVLGEAVLVELGDRMAERFGDPLFQARTFAPLILDCVVSAGGVSAGLGRGVRCLASGRGGSARS